MAMVTFRRYWGTVLKYFCRELEQYGISPREAPQARAAKERHQGIRFAINRLFTDKDAYYFVFFPPLPPPLRSLVHVIVFMVL